MVGGLSIYIYIYLFIYLLKRSRSLLSFFLHCFLVLNCFFTVRVKEAELILKKTMKISIFVEASI